jgi:hypothetical protein
LRKENFDSTSSNIKANENAQFSRQNYRVLSQVIISVKDCNLVDQPDKSHVTRATEPDETHHSHVQFADPDRLTINYNAAKKTALIKLLIIMTKTKRLITNLKNVTLIEKLIKIFTYLLLFTSFYSSFIFLFLQFCLQRRDWHVRNDHHSFNNLFNCLFQDPMIVS